MGRGKVKTPTSQQNPIFSSFPLDSEMVTGYESEVALLLLQITFPSALSEPVIVINIGEVYWERIPTNVQETVGLNI